MKKICIYIICLFAYFVCEAQTYPIPSNIGGPTTLVKTPNYGGLQAGLIPFSFADTTAANAALTYGKNYNGFLIYTQTPQATWWRLADSSKWVMILPQGGGTPISGQAWINPGNSNLFTDASLNGGFGTLGNNGVYFKTNGITRLYLDRNGIAPETGTSVGIGIDPADSNRVTYFSGGGSTPTWQQTLTAGSTLNTNNTISMGNTSFIWSGGVGSSLEATIGQFSLETLQGGVAFSPYTGQFLIDTLNNETFQNQLMGWTSTFGANRGKVGYITIGSGLSLSSGVLSNSGVVTTPTWQQTLTAGSTLTGANTITGGGYNFTWNNIGVLTLNGSTNYPAKFIGTSGGGVIIGALNSTYGGVWANNVSPSTSNYTLGFDGSGTVLNGVGGIDLSISSQSYLRVRSNGNVGISAGSNPSELLSLGTSGTIGGVLSLAGSTSGKAIIQTSSAAGTPTLTLPTTTGTLALTSDLTGLPYIALTGTSTATGEITVDMNGNNLFLTNTSGSGDFLFYDAGFNENVTLGFAGNVFFTANRTSNKAYIYSSAIAGGSAGDAVTIVDPSTGELGVAPNLAFRLMKDSTDMYTSNGRIFVKDASGNKTQISPHNDKGEWIYKSTDKNGVTTEINMIRLAELLEKVTGEKLIYKTKD